MRRPGLTLGYVPQRLQLDPTLPLSVAPLSGARTRAARPAALGGALAEVGAGHLERALMAELSGGEFQRVTLARALLRDPDLLLLDEPAQGVDFAGQLELYALIERVRDQRGCGVLLVSHDLHVVMAATDRVICLNRHVCCAGRPEAVSRHPEYLNLFGPQAARGLAIYSHEHDHAHDLAGAVVEDERRTAPSAPAGRASAMLDDFVLRALLGGLGVAALAGPLGCFVVWRRMAYFGNALAHSALLGIAVGVLLAVDLTARRSASASPSPARCCCCSASASSPPTRCSASSPTPRWRSA